jgi:hypothetical protein
MLWLIWERGERQGLLYFCIFGVEEDVSEAKSFDHCG